MRIETDRLILRPFEEKDLEDLYALLSDGEVVKYEPYLPMNREAVRQELLQRMGSDEFLAMELKENGRVIGNVYLGKRPFDSAELGYLLARAYWKQGYAREACRQRWPVCLGKGCTAFMRSVTRKTQLPGVCWRGWLLKGKRI